MEFDTVDAFDENGEEKDFVSPLIKKIDLNDDDDLQITAIKKAPGFIMSDRLDLEMCQDQILQDCNYQEEI